MAILWPDRLVVTGTPRWCDPIGGTYLEQNGAVVTGCSDGMTSMFVLHFWWYNMTTYLVLSSTMVWPDPCDIFGTIWCGCYYVVVTMAMVWLHFWWHDMTTCLVLSSTMVWPDRCDRRRSSAATSCPTADWTRTVSIVSPVIRFVLIISICIHLSYFQPSRQTTRWCR